MTAPALIPVGVTPGGMTATSAHLSAWDAVTGAVLILVVLAGMLLFALLFAISYARLMDRVEAWLRARRAVLPLDGPEMASSQERRAARALGYHVDHWWGR